MLHLILTLLTCGAWSNVWVVLAARYWGVSDYHNPEAKRGMDRRTWLAVGVLVMVQLIAFAVLVSAGTFAANTVQEAVNQTSTQSVTTDGDAAAAAPVVNEPADYQPTAADYRVTIKSTERQCFGSYGCNVVGVLRVTVTPDAAGIPVALTVTVTGDKDGPIIQTVDLDDEGKFYDDSIIMTVSKSAKLRATVTEVEVSE
jgi:hypothetical protein